MLAWLSFLDGKLEESLRLHAQAEEIEPREAKMKYQIGLVLLKSGRPADAIMKFKSALEIEPWHADATQATKTSGRWEFTKASANTSPMRKRVRQSWHTLACASGLYW